MSIRLYDTAAGGIRDFVPIEPGKVAIYLCGATVQAPPHIGHIRSGLNFDVLSRWLTYRGYDVTLCRNVTDIDDKILRRAADEDVEFWRIAARNERAFSDGYRVLGCLPPTIEPRATGHVPEMVELMHDLIERGHAYAAGGDVYFDVRSYPEYGSFSGVRLDDMQSADDADPKNAKRDPRDFTLWKGAKPGEPAWQTPWGSGRPGWHLECSAMARRYLGERFDIHGGGRDLVFPHHENEIAQSKARGDGFANYWLHNAWVTIAGEKMSKSLGNSVLVSEMVRQYRPIVLRYYLVWPHYRSTIEYSPESLANAAVGYERIEQFVRHASELVGPTEPGPVLEAFAAAMDDDLKVPEAIAVVHDTVRAGNSALASDDKDAVGRYLRQTRGMLDVLGLDPLGEPWVSADAAGTERELRAVVDNLVEVLVDTRTAARANRDFATADAIRDRLTAAGIVLEDGANRTRWDLRP